MFALCARERVRDGGVWSQPSITIVALFVGIVLIPTTLYLYLAHPSWAWLYLVDPGDVPGPVVLSVVAACAGAVLGGYYLGVRLIRARRERLALGILGGYAAVLLLCVALLRERLMSYGSYADFEAGRALPLGDVKLGYVLVAVILGLAAAVGFVAWELMRDSRRVAARN